MKTIRLLCIILLSSFSLVVYSQKNKINATYMYDIDKFLSIRGNNFILYGRPPFVSSNYGLNRGDIVLAEGKVEYESNNFIKLTSKNYEKEVQKNMTIIESIDSSLNEGLRFNFIFPFKGEYIIILFLDLGIDGKIYEFKNEEKIILSVCKDSVTTFSFVILYETPIIYPTHNYLRNDRFHCSEYTIKNTDSNSFEISIPDLTNSYFNRYLINGEYIKVDKDRDRLFWQNEIYTRFGGYYRSIPLSRSRSKAPAL